MNPVVDNGFCDRFLVRTKPIPATEKNVREDATSKSENSKSDDMQPPPAKRVRRRGQNKSRPRPSFIPFSEMLCPSCYHSGKGGKICKFGDKCRYIHDIAKYMSSKSPDVSNECYLYTTYGKCPYGRACRFAGSHLTASLENMVDESLYDPTLPERTLNVIPRSLQEKLRKRKEPFLKSEAYLRRLNEMKKVLSEGTRELSTNGVKSEEQELRANTVDVDSGSAKTAGRDSDGIKQHCRSSDEPMESSESYVQLNSGALHVQTCGPLTDEDSVKLKPTEKKKVK